MTIKKSRSVLAVALLSTAFLATTPARAESQEGPSKGEPQLSSGTCVEAFFFIQVDAEEASRHVPEDRFKPQVNPATGKVPVTVFSEDCSISLGDAEPIPVTPSGVNIRIQTPEGEDARHNHSYNRLWATDSRTHYRWMQQLGSGTLIEDSVFEYNPGPPASAFAEVPGWFTFTIVGVGTEEGVHRDGSEEGEAAAIKSGHWQLGRFGAVRNIYPHTNTLLFPGLAVVRAEPGSPLADMIGTGPMEVEGLLGFFDFTGVSEGVD